MTAEPAEPTAEYVTELADGSVELSLPAENGSVPVARRYVQQRWTHLDEEVLDDVALVVTELVSNAVRHGAPEICVRLRAEPFAVDVAVLDHGPGTPRKREADEVVGQGSGRGLAIVDRLAAAWGVQPLDDRVGKIVWASIDRV
ncbi:ATP-binding protein [Jatrophihabitans fulvus]